MQRKKKQMKKLALARTNMKLQNPGLVTFYNIRKQSEVTPNPRIRFEM